MLVPSFRLWQALRRPHHHRRAPTRCVLPLLCCRSWRSLTPHHAVSPLQQLNELALRMSDLPLLQFLFKQSRRRQYRSNQPPPQSVWEQVRVGPCCQQAWPLTHSHQPRPTPTPTSATSTPIPSEGCARRLSCSKGVGAEEAGGGGGGCTAVPSRGCLHPGPTRAPQTKLE